MAEHHVEIEALRAEVEHWKAHAQEAGDGFAQVCKDFARVSARNVVLRAAIDEARSYCARPAGVCLPRETDHA